MNIFKLGFRTELQKVEYSSNIQYVPYRFDVKYSKSLERDIFEKSPISFQASVEFENCDFEKKYSSKFFRKILREGITCAYTGVKMIPRSDIDDMINMQVFKKKSSFAMPYLRIYKDQMFGVERQVYEILENESKKHPDMKLKELIGLKYPVAEKALIRQQSAVLDRVSLAARGMNANDHKKTRKIVSSAFDQIFAQNPLPEERFKRKEFIYRLDNANLSNKAMKDKVIKIAEKLPQSSSSVHAFIVKYAQPYKIKYIAPGHFEKIPRSSEELAIRLLKPSVATDEHIYPQKLYKEEEIARRCGVKEAQDLSQMRVTILTTDFINGEKGDMLFDDFVRKTKYDVKANVQKHVDRLIEIDHKWLKDGRIDDANQLADYILLLKEEFQRRSKIVDIDIAEFEKEIPEIKSRTQQHRQKISQKRLKKTGRAENSHGEAYYESNGHMMENRKVQVHSSRYKQ